MKMLVHVLMYSTVRVNDIIIAIMTPASLLTLISALIKLEIYVSPIPWPNMPNEVYHVETSCTLYCIIYTYIQYIVSTTHTCCLKY